MSVVSLTGTTRGVEVGETAHAAILQGGGVWKRAAKKMVPAFRAYIDDEALGEGGVSSTRLVVPDSPTSIRLTERETNQTRLVYDLSGRQRDTLSDQLARGIYIKNGKKYLKKN